MQSLQQISLSLSLSGLLSFKSHILLLYFKALETALSTPVGCSDCCASKKLKEALKFKPGF